MSEASLPFNLRDRVAIVTGAGRGIGRGIARVFARAGAHVVVATRTAAPGEETVRLIEKEGGRAKLVLGDLGKRADIFSLLEQAGQWRDRIDIVIHNAATWPNTTIDALSEEDLDDTLNLNLKAAFWLTKAAAPMLRKAPSPRLLFTSSIGGTHLGVAGQVPYCASKAGINGFIRAAAVEYGPDRFTVNGVEPGSVITDALMTWASPEQQAAMAAGNPVGKLGLPEDIAHAMLFLASDQAGYITGQTIVVDGGETVQVNVQGGSVGG